MKVDRMPTMVQTHGDKKEEIGSNIFKKEGLKYAFIHAINVTAGLLFIRHHVSIRGAIVNKITAFIELTFFYEVAMNR